MAAARRAPGPERGRAGDAGAARRPGVRARSAARRGGHRPARQRPSRLALHRPRRVPPGAARPDPPTAPRRRRRRARRRANAPRRWPRRSPTTNCGSPWRSSARARSTRRRAAEGANRSDGFTRSEPARRTPRHADERRRQQDPDARPARDGGSADAGRSARDPSRAGARLRPVDGPLRSDNAWNGSLRPHLQQRRQRGRRLRQRHALRRRPAGAGQRRARLRGRDRGRRHRLRAARRVDLSRRHGAATPRPGTRSRWRSRSTTSAPSR